VILFDRAVERYADRLALVADDGSYSFAAVDVLSRCAARLLAAEGIRRGDRVGAWSRNSHSLLVLQLAVMRLGATWCPVGAYASTASASGYLRSLEPRAVLYEEGGLARMQDLRRAFPALVCVSTDHVFRQAARDAAVVGETASIHDDDGDDASRIVAIVPTGGTTNAPKAVMQSLTAFERLIEALRYCLEYDDDMPICLAASPLSHSAGAQAFAVWTLGGVNIVMREFSTERVLGQIQEKRVTHMFLPPTALSFLLAQPNLGQFDCSSLRSVRVGGESVSAARLKEAVDAFGPCICETYGQIEAPFLTWLDRKTIAAAAAGHHGERLSSCGRPTPSVTLRIGEPGQPSVLHERGEIVIKGSGVPCPYFGDVHAPADDSWHRTGDIGYVDEYGYVYLVGRARDLIISGAINVHAADVEAAVLALDHVRECAVVGMPDPILGEAVHAIVTVDDGYSVSETAIIAHCQATLGKLRAPRSVTFSLEIPKTGVGKIDKVALRRNLTERQDAGRG